MTEQEASDHYGGLVKLPDGRIGTIVGQGRDLDGIFMVFVKFSAEETAWVLPSQLTKAP